MFSTAAVDRYTMRISLKVKLGLVSDSESGTDVPDSTVNARVSMQTRERCKTGLPAIIFLQNS